MNILQCAVNGANKLGSAYFFQDVTSTSSWKKMGGCNGKWT